MVKRPLQPGLSPDLLGPDPGRPSRGARAWRAILARLSEPSTYAGLMGLAMMLGATEAEWLAVSQGLALVCGLITVVLAERGQR